MSDLRAKLAALGHVASTERESPPGPATGVASVLGATEREVPSGTVLVRTTRFPAEASWGEALLTRPRFGGALRGYVEAEDLAACEPSRVVFVDTETTGLAGGSGTYAFLVGVGRFERDAFVLHQLFLRGPWEERPLLEAATELFAGAKAVVSYNGKSFDVPLLTGRFALHGLPDPLHGTPHVDLLHLARRLWRERLPSCSLGEVERGALGMARGAEDVPGHMIPELYFAFLRTGDAQPLRGVMYHNELDICSLAALLGRVDDVLERRVEIRCLPWLDLVSLARTLAALGDEPAALELFGRAAERSAEMPASAVAVANDAWLRAGKLAKRAGHFEAAFAFFRRGVEVPTCAGGHVMATIEITKLLEHQSQQIADALSWVGVGLDALPDVVDGFARRRLGADLAYRRDRLLRKANAQEVSRAARQATSS